MWILKKHYKHKRLANSNMCLQKTPQIQNTATVNTEKHCKHKRLALQASRQTGWWREENWVLPILILASATLLLLLLFQVDHIAALARQQGNLLLPTNPFLAFCRFCSWSNRSEEVEAVGGIWPDIALCNSPPQPISSLPSSTTSLYLPPPPPLLSSLQHNFIICPTSTQKQSKPLQVYSSNEPVAVNRPPRVRHNRLPLHSRAKPHLLCPYKVRHLCTHCSFLYW